MCCVIKFSTDLKCLAFNVGLILYCRAFSTSLLVYPHFFSFVKDSILDKPDSTLSKPDFTLSLGLIAFATRVSSTVAICVRKTVTSLTKWRDSGEIGKRSKCHLGHKASSSNPDESLSFADPLYLIPPLRP